MTRKEKDENGKYLLPWWFLNRVFTFQEMMEQNQGQHFERHNTKNTQSVKTKTEHNKTPIEARPRLTRVSFEYDDESVRSLEGKDARKWSSMMGSLWSLRPEVSEEFDRLNWQTEKPFVKRGCKDAFALVGIGVLIVLATVMILKVVGVIG
jgi:hypothetical protein